MNEIDKKKVAKFVCLFKQTIFYKYLLVSVRVIILIIVGAFIYVVTQK